MGDRRRVRGLLLFTLVPLVLVVGVLVGAAAGTGEAPPPAALTTVQAPVAVLPPVPTAPPVVAPPPVIAPPAATEPPPAPVAPEPPPPPQPVTPTQPVTPPPPTATATIPPPAPVTGAPPGDRWAPDGAERIDIGGGPQSAAIFRRRALDTAAPVVVFLHGWAAIDPRRYASWITHLVRRGTTIVYPSYQERPATDTIAPLGNLLATMREVVATIPVEPAQLVVAGHSAGGALAADYAASALAVGLPVPAAVYSVFPGRKINTLSIPIPPADAADIPATTRLLVLAGERDSAVGTTPARELARSAAHARTTLALVVDDAVDDHSAPRRSDAVAQQTFWTPLDRLVDETGPR